MNPAPTERLHALDAVRGFALLLGVAFHATMSFLPGPQAWIVMDEQRSEVMAATFFTLHIFRMTVFFLIAGYFGRLLLERRGVGGFIVDRARRIAAPLAIFWPMVLMAIIAVLVWNTIETLGGIPKNAPPPPAITPTAFPLTHLWFLWVLLLFYPAMLVLRGLGKLLDRGGHVARLVDGLVGFLTRSIVGPVILAAPVSVALWLKSDLMAWVGIPTPDQSLIPGAIALTAYGAAFTFGWLIQRQDGQINAFTGRWALNLVVAVAATTAAYLMVRGTPIFTPMADDTQRAAFSALYALSIWCWTFGLIGAALTFLSGHSPLRRYVADASYWVYIVHIPLVMALHVLLRDAPMAWPVKYGLVLAGTLIPAFVTYELLVRHTHLGWLLNGRRIPWRAKPQPSMQALTQQGIA
ncbi:MAG: acyltransferase family protein [Caulobacter sp.]|nr:acyltransferase family protein [Caulobacter sp.]